LSIGCKGSENAHLLTQTIARTVARESGCSIEWHSVGVNGGSVDVVHYAAMTYLCQHRPDAACAAPHSLFSSGMAANSMSAAPPPPPEDDEIARRLSAPTVTPSTAAAAAAAASAAAADSPRPAPPADACVVLCGLNDFKRLWRGRTPAAFRRDLRRFLADIRARVGPACALFLPALPLEVTRFPEPLHTFAVRLAAAFDAEKRRAAADLPGVFFVPKPGPGFWARARRDVGDVIAEDGVHPNEAGYAVYGQLLGRAVARRLARPGS
jgi:lysophospholipase L1-like esterase